MQIYFMLVLVVAVMWLYVTMSADPLQQERQLDDTINYQIVNNVLDYSIDKFFFETEWEWLKPWWYSLWYYLDSSQEKYNDSIHLKYLWNWKMTDQIYSKLWEYHKDIWWLSRFINWEDDWHNFWVLVEEISFDWSWIWNWDKTAMWFKITLWSVEKKWSSFKFITRQIFYK